METACVWVGLGHKENNVHVCGAKLFYGETRKLHIPWNCVNIIEKIKPLTSVEILIPSLNCMIAKVENGQKNSQCHF